jgi:hypothetical protein
MLYPVSFVFVYNCKMQNSFHRILADVFLYTFVRLFIQVVNFQRILRADFLQNIHRNGFISREARKYRPAILQK